MKRGNLQSEPRRYMINPVFIENSDFRWTSTTCVTWPGTAYRLFFQTGETLITGKDTPFGSLRSVRTVSE